MTLGELLFSLPTEKRKLFRKLESIDKKIINNKWSNLFNKICLKNNMLPKYVNFKIYLYRNIVLPEKFCKNIFLPHKFYQIYFYQNNSTKTNFYHNNSAKINFFKNKVL